MPLRTGALTYDDVERLNPSINPYAARLLESAREDKTSIWFAEALLQNKGLWREKLGLSKDSKLFLEIGCHLGKTLSELAQDHPEMGFLGMDITFKRVVKAFEKASRHSKHVGTLFAQAQTVQDIFSSLELSGVLLFFPDPWSKKANQRKHRLIQRDFLPKLQQVLEPEGFLWIKMDQKDYFDETQELLLKDGWRQSLNPNLSPFGSLYESTFETRFKAQGLSIYESLWHPPLTSFEGRKNG